jgi:hypothetical protein
LKPEVAAVVDQAEEQPLIPQISMVWMEDAGVALAVFNYLVEL